MQQFFLQFIGMIQHLPGQACYKKGDNFFLQMIQFQTTLLGSVLQRQKLSTTNLLQIPGKSGRARLMERVLYIVRCTRMFLSFLPTMIPEGSGVKILGQLLP